MKIDVKAMKTKELVEFYNEHADSPIKKFENRATAEKRVKALAAEIESEPEEITAVIDDETVETEIDDYTADEMNSEARETSIPSNSNLSEAVRRTWKDERVKAKRSQRSAVEVGGVMYKSVRAAFEDLGLPMSKYNRFRGRLKAAGQLIAFEYEWKNIPTNYIEE